MKITLFLTAFLFPVILFSQLEVNGNLTQQFGMEYNPLNNPRTILAGGEDGTIESNQFPFVSYSKVYIHGKYKGDGVTVGLKPKVEYSFYPAYEEANQLKGNVEQYASFKVNKKWKFYQEFEVVFNQRNGDAAEIDVFNIPRSYNRFRGGLGLVYKFDKQWSFDLQAYSLKNVFQADDGAENFYTANAVRGKLRNKLKGRQSLKLFETTAELQKRNWVRGVEDDEENINTGTEMIYWSVKTAARFELNDEVSWKPYVKIVGRDSERKEQDWYGLKIGASTTWRRDDLSVSWSTNVYRKVHPNLMPGGGGPLKYLILNNGLTVGYDIDENWSGLFTTRFTKRYSSFDDESSRGFRPYTNLYVGLGVRLKF